MLSPRLQVDCQLDVASQPSTRPILSVESMSPCTPYLGASSQSQRRHDGNEVRDIPAVFSSRCGAIAEEGEKSATTIDDVLVMILTQQKLHDTEVAALREKQTQIDTLVEQMRSEFKGRMDKQLGILSNVVNRLNAADPETTETPTAMAASAGKLPSPSPDPSSDAQRQPPAESQATRSTRRKASKSNQPNRQDGVSRPFKPMNPPPSALRALRAANRALTNPTQGPTARKSAPTPARPTPTPPRSIPLPLPIRPHPRPRPRPRPAHRHHESRSLVPFPDGTRRPYIYHPHQATVRDEWAIYKHGLHGQPAVQQLETELGSCWRGDAYDRSWRSRRRELWDRIQGMLDEGWAEEEAVEEMQRLADEGGGTVEGLVARLITERREAKSAAAGKRRKRKRVNYAVGDSDDDSI